MESPATRGREAARLSVRLRAIPITLLWFDGRVDREGETPHPLEPETRIVCNGAPQGAAQPYGEWIDEAEPVGF
jgi:hypothetical protein